MENVFKIEEVSTYIPSIFELYRQNMCNKWKIHFFEIFGDVGIFHYEEEGKKKMTTLRKEVINPIPTYLFL